MSAISTERVRELNDAFRTTFVGGAVMLTPSVEALSSETRRKLLAEVRGFTDFRPGNDPHQEHDFGSFDLDGERYLFKIEYYDTSYKGRSDNPADPQKTRRVLTVMAAAEW